MVAWRWWWVLLAIGCVERSLDVPEGVRDLGVAVDASRPRPDAGLCEVHTREPVALASISLLGGVGVAPLGAGVRLLVEYALRDGCDVPADLTTKLQPGDATDFVEVSAFVWRGTTGCMGPERIVRRVVTVPGHPFDNLRLVVRDAGGVLGVDIARDGVPNPSCAPVALGASCVSDCGCAATDATATCLSLESGGRMCGHGCTADLECPGDGARFCIAPDQRCIAASVCRDAASCPLGQHLVDCRCESAFPPGGLCACDAECSTGTICDGSSCLQPCVIDADCGAVCSGEGCGVCLEGRCTFTI